MRDVYIVTGSRSPLASVRAGANGELNTSSISLLTPQELAAQVLRDLFRKSNIEPEFVDFFYMGSAISQKVEKTLYQAPAKFVLRTAAQGRKVRALGRNVEKACSTGLISIWAAAKKIMLGKGDLAIAGGVDMMSRQPNEVIIAGLTDPTTNKIMAELSDQKALELGFTRGMQDAYALESYQFAASHLEDHEVVSIRVGEELLNYDEEVKKKAARITAAHMKRSPLYPGCKITTPLNSSKYSDAAAFILLASKEALREHNLRPSARIVAFAEHSEEEEKDFIIAPYGAARKALRMADMHPDEIDHWENNEAFATSPLYLMREFGITRQKINSWGGAIAHGHPIGATGGVLTVKLLRILEKENKRYGLVVICNAISEATAMIVERMGKEG
jgi:acetyl-CoA C-acetyltransferase